MTEEIEEVVTEEMIVVAVETDPAVEEVVVVHLNRRKETAFIELQTAIHVTT
jgi:hypothetical protein